MDNTPLESKDFEKNRLVFEYELKSLPIPFHDIILNNEDVKNEVFEYFLITSLKPCKYLFLRDHFDDSEIKDGIRESNEKLPDATGIKNAVASFVGQTDFEKNFHQIVDKFYASVSKSTLANEYYCHSLNNTKLSKSLKNIENTIRDFDKITLTKSEHDPKDYATAFANDIILKLEKLGLPKLTTAILTDFDDKTESIEIENALILWSNEFAKEFGVSVDEAKSKYRELKRYADSYFNEYLKKVINTNKIQALFNFIDFLNENKSEYITTYLPLVDELSRLRIKRNQLKPDNNHKDRQKYNAVQKQIEEKFAPLYENVTLPILAKLKELGIWAGDKVYTSIYNGNIGPIMDLTKIFTNQDVNKIGAYKKKYISFRSETNSSFLSLEMVFQKLDEVLNILFDFFDDGKPSGNIEVNKLGGGKESDPSQVYERSIRITKKADKETARRLNCKEGDSYSILPEPKSKAELSERFEKLHSQRVFEAHKRAFIKKYGDGNKKIIEDELKTLNKFIEKANKRSTQDTFKSNSISDLDEYSRLANGYYQNKPFVNQVFSFYNNNAVEVHARYFLYRDWLIGRLDNLQSPKQDNRFWLDTFVDKSEPKTHRFKGIKSQIDEGGHYIVNGLKHYTPQLVVFLISRDLPVTDMDAQIKTTINGYEYLKTYEQAYSDGVAKFEKEFAISADTLYGTNAERYVRDMHYNYFHTQVDNLYNGWHFVKQQYPTVITHKNIRKFGFYSGMISKVDEMVGKYPKLFADFDQCEHQKEVKPEQKEKKKSEITHEDIPINMTTSHNEIFKGNAFDVWQSMFNDFGIGESSRTDVKFMYEEMKKDGLIHETVNQTSFLNWISKTYQIIVQKTSNYSKTKKRNSIYATAKHRYKG